MSSAPLPVEPLAFPCASPAPAPPSHSGALSRRAVLAGGVAAALCPGPARADETLVADTSGAAAPGPALQGEIGKPMRLTLANGLDAPTAFSLQGVRADPAPGFAGLNATPLAQGERREIAFTPREAGFGLYAPYVAPFGAGEAAGLFGAVVIAEAAAPTVDLDATALLCGDASNLRVNAGPTPLTLQAPPGGRVRLRLANAAPDLSLTLLASAPVQIVAIDGQPCEMFAPRDGEIPLCPSARIELMFDLGDKEWALAPRGGAPLVRVAPQGAHAAPRPPLAPLPANPRLPREIALERAQRVSLQISGTPERGFALRGEDSRVEAPSKTANGWPARPLFKTRRATPVVLTLANQTPTPQTLRLEGHWARVLHALDDGWDPYWRDALFVAPGRALHAAFVADAPGPWPLASASPEKRMKGMAGWFVVS